MKLIQILGSFWLILLIVLISKVIYSINELSPKPTIWRWIITISVCSYMLIYGLRRRHLATISTCFLGVLLLFTASLINHCFSISIVLFFVTSSKATQFKKEKKKRLEDDKGKGIQRDWRNMISNGGVAIILSLFYLLESGSREMAIDFDHYYNSSWFAISALGALSCANGDTWASELGTVLSTGQPYLITSMRKVPKGTNGGISFFGLLLSALGGLTIGTGFCATLFVSLNETSPHQLIPILMVGLFGGLFGSLIDSLLGATLQFSGLNTKTGTIVEEMAPNVQHISGLQILDNHCVNLLSNVMTAMVTPYFAIYLWTYF